MISKIEEAPADVVTIENLGPIERLDLPAKPGTIVVCRGPNGSGKSTALEVVDSIVTKRPAKLTSRDGTVGGFAKGFGVTIKLARNGSTRRSNDLCVTAVEDDIDIATLVDPGLKDESAADLRRIKALCNLVGAVVTLEDLYALVGSRETFESIVRKESLEIANPVELVEAVKRDLESAARGATSAAEQAHSAAVAKLAENDGIDLDAPHDSQQLQESLSQAIREHESLKAAADAWTKAQQRRAEAEQRLTEVTAAYTGPSIEAALARVEALSSEITAQTKAIEEVEARLIKMANQLATMKQEKKAADEALASAKSHQTTIAAWQETIDSAICNSPASDLELMEAAGRLKDAQAAMEYGQRVRDALQRKQVAEQREADAQQHRTRAEKLREASKATLDVLAESVRAVSDRIDFSPDFRLIVKHPQRKQCYFSDLSHGERWSLCLDMVLEAARRRNEPAVLAVPQEAWEGLDGHNRKLIIDKVHGSELIVYTAEADREDDPSAAITTQVL